MSARGGQPREDAPAGQPAELPPAASLLSVPIFRAAARQQAAPRQAGPQPRPGAAPCASDPAAAASGVPGAGATAAAGAETAYTVVGAEAAKADAPPPAPAGNRDALPGMPAPALKAVDGAESYRTLLAYWRSLSRQGYAPVARLDTALIAERWPYAMLLRVPPGGVVDIVHVYVPGAPAEGGDTAAAGAQHPFARDQASQISSWVLEIAQDAAGSRQPSRRSETFYQAGRPRRLTAELLPCFVEGDNADHLLLQLRDG